MAYPLHVQAASGAVGVIATLSRKNSERWFSELHTSARIELDVFYTLGLVGEAGEIANLVKKHLRGSDVTHDQMRSELADTFTYLMLLAGELGIDLVEAWWDKQAVCEQRWGNPTPPVQHVYHGGS